MSNKSEGNYTSRAHVFRDGYTGENLKHPCIAFMQKAHAFFDSMDHADPSTIHEFYTDDFSMLSAHGDEMTSEGNFDDSHALVQGGSKFYLEPYKRMAHNGPWEWAVIEHDDGFDEYCTCNLFVDVAGEPAAGETKVKDEDGKEWDAVIPVFYHFDIVKVPDSPHGSKFRHIKAIKDTGIVNDMLDNRGVGHKRSAK